MQSFPATWLKFKCWVSVSGTLLTGGKGKKCSASFQPFGSTNLSQAADIPVHLKEARIRNETHLSYKISRKELKEQS